MSGGAARPAVAPTPAPATHPYVDEVEGMAATAKPGLATLVADDTSEHAVSLYPGSDKVRQAVLDFLTKHSAGTS